MESFTAVMYIIGTIAFAVSGAIVAIENEMDIFGVNILAITTATGGGLIRDLLLGRIPPMIFVNPSYVYISVLVANLVIILFRLQKRMKKQYLLIYEWTLLICDTLGLAAFTADTVNTVMNTEYKDNLFEVVFLAVLTAVGGGLLRDIMANKLPYIFVKHIYACASLIGALLTGILWQYLGGTVSMIIGFLSVINVRLLAAVFNWNLPKIKNKN